MTGKNERLVLWLQAESRSHWEMGAISGFEFHWHDLVIPEAFLKMPKTTRSPPNAVNRVVGHARTQGLHSGIRLPPHYQSLQGQFGTRLYQKPVSVAKKVTEIEMSQNMEGVLKIGSIEMRGGREATGGIFSGSLVRWIRRWPFAFKALW